MVQAFQLALTMQLDCHSSTIRTEFAEALALLLLLFLLAAARRQTVLLEVVLRRPRGRPGARFSRQRLQIDERLGIARGRAAREPQRRGRRLLVEIRRHRRCRAPLKDWKQTNMQTALEFRDCVKNTIRLFTLVTPRNVSANAINTAVSSAISAR